MIYRQKRRHRKVFWSAVWPNVVLWFFKILSANINKGGSFHFQSVDGENAYLCCSGPRSGIGLHIWERSQTV